MVLPIILQLSLVFVRFCLIVSFAFKARGFTSCKSIGNQKLPGPGDRTPGPEMGLVLFAFVRTQSGREELINCEVKLVNGSEDLWHG